MDKLHLHPVDPATPISPLGKIRLAVTVDDLLLIKGYELPPDHTHLRNAKLITKALQSHAVKGVYQFSNTAPLARDPSLAAIFDHWVESGHHVGNHTHNHPSLNWMTAADYIEEVEIAEKYLGSYIAAAPRRCFRFCMDMWGDSQCKCDEVLTSLEKKGYTSVPVSLGFHDIRWNAAYLRVRARGSSDDMEVLRSAYVDSAVRELRVHAANARAVEGRDTAHLWLIHGTSIAADCLERILERFSQAGTQFVSLDEAMEDSFNAMVPPRVSPEFIFQIERWALAKGVPVNDLHPKVLDLIEQMHPADGESANEATAAVRKNIAANSKAVLSPFPLSPDQVH